VSTGWQADAVIKAEALSVLSAAVLSPRYSAEVRAHAAGVVGLVVNHGTLALVLRLVRLGCTLFMWCVFLFLLAFYR
jgi:hypothetical protein